MSSKKEWIIVFVCGALFISLSGVGSLDSSADSFSQESKFSLWLERMLAGEPTVKSNGHDKTPEELLRNLPDKEKLRQFAKETAKLEVENMHVMRKNLE